jgi:signal transduction histidine kinase
MQTILVVDDESGVRMSLEMVFRSLYRVVSASSSAEALDLLRKESPQVAILDIKMVGESGLDLLPALKSHDSQIEVVMLTGYETIDGAKLSLRRGACDFLSKPFDLATLKQAIERAFKLRAASEAAEQNRLMMHEIRTANPALTADHFLMQMGVLHDVRNMQTVLNGYFELMEMSLEEMKGAGASAVQLNGLHSQIKAVHHSLNTCMQMMNRFLSFGRQSLQSQPEADIAAILMDIKSLIQTHPDARQCSFAIVPSEETATVQVPSGDVIRILLNVVLNAAQSTKKKQNITLRIAQVAGSSAFAGLTGGNSFVIGQENLVPGQTYVTVSVQDQGPGIPVGMMQKMLQTFTTSKAETGGSGLGLGVVKQLVFQNKGALRITSVVNEGTLVSCALPAKQP